MTAMAPTDLLVAEVTEAQCRRVMAERAALTGWMHRPARAKMLGEIDRLLDVWLELCR